MDKTSAKQAKHAFQVKDGWPAESLALNRPIAARDFDPNKFQKL